MSEILSIKKRQRIVELVERIPRSCYTRSRIWRESPLWLDGNNEFIVRKPAPT
jgi:hypothetical protein